MNLKFKARVVARRYPKSRPVAKPSPRVAEGPPPMPEPSRMVFVGALDVEAGEAVTLNIPPNADPATVAAAIQRANEERAAKAKRETKHLRGMFLDRLALEPEPGEK